MSRYIFFVLNKIEINLMSKSNIIKVARDTIKKEGNAIMQLIDLIDSDFAQGKNRNQAFLYCFQRLVV